mgnify:FL=1
MAKKRVEIYEFTPGVAGTTTILIGGFITLDQLLIVTNVTDNVMLYNFADSGFAGTTCTFARTNGPGQLSQAIANSDGVTTITLQFNTSAMSSTDDILIYIEEENRDGMTIRPYAFGTDAIERIRVSNPTSLIDADFEYGLQPTKWAGFGTVKGYPSAYDNPAVDLEISSCTTDYTTSSSTNSKITVVFTSAHELLAGEVINMSGLNSGISGFSRADGTYIIDAVTNTTTINYYARGVVGTTSGQNLFTPESIARKGALYANAKMPATTISSTGTDPSVITIGFASPHGLVPGTPIHVILGDSGTNPDLATGPFVIQNTPSLNSFKFTARGGGAVSGMGVTSATSKVLAISNSAILHRAADGGVLLSTKTPTYAASVVRQTKRYFRYQSGKGYLWSSGTLFAPNYDVQSVSAAATAVGSLITIKTDDIDHGLQVGATVEINGVMTSGYNDTYVVSTIVDDFTFKVAAKTTLGDTNAVLDQDCKLFVTSWTGASVRAGMFDDANGVFFEYDGGTLYAVKRSATNSITGTMAVTSGSSEITGTNTRFSEQIRAGDRIVIKGMVHYVSSVTSNTEMFMTPDYRGIDASGVRAQKVVDKKIPQEHFNLDKINGAGPSGYDFSPNHMQMLGLEFSWYGAGFINWMVRGPNGDWMYIHREKNNNINEEAYMRTANLPVRYSIDNDSPVTYLTSTIDSDVTTMTVKDTSQFQPTGTLLVDNEVIKYGGLDSAQNQFTNCIREATYDQYLQGTTTTLSAGGRTGHASNTGLIEISNTCSPTLTHWGSALVMDGGFDFDRGYVFNFANSHNSSGDKIETTPLTSFLIRLAPSVSNASVGRLGAKELLNRSQLLVQQCAIALSRGSSSSGEVVVQGILNPKNFQDATWSSLNSVGNGGQPSFAQIARTDDITWKSGTPSYALPGERIFAFVANASRQDAVVTDLDLSELKEMSGSPLGGDFMFPDGSDILAINAFVLSGDVKGTLQLRWQETQA